MKLIIVTTERIQNYKIKEVKGPVFGLTVRARGIGKDIFASLKGLVGGEITQYTEMLEDARKQALDRMVENAKKQWVPMLSLWSVLTRVKLVKT